MQWAADTFNFGSNPDLGLRISMYRMERKYFELLFLKTIWKSSEKHWKCWKNIKEGRIWGNIEKNIGTNNMW